MKYAGFWIRFIAVLLDGFIVTLITVPFALILGQESPLLGWVGLLIAWLYFALQTSSAAQATLGKRVFGLKVGDMNGKQLSFGHATGRYFSKIISGLPLYIGFMMAGFTEKKQALHDLIAKTVVYKA